MTVDQVVGTINVSMSNVWTEYTVVSTRSAAVSRKETNVLMFNVLPTWIAKPTSVLLTDVLVTSVKIKSVVTTNIAGMKLMPLVMVSIVLISMTVVLIKTDMANHQSNAIIIRSLTLVTSSEVSISCLRFFF